MSIETNEIGSSIRLTLPVTVMLEKRMINHQRWQVPSWNLYGIAVGGAISMENSTGDKVSDTADGEVFSWSGYTVKLYKDACERYWHALIGDKPLVYVVCKDDVDDSPHGHTVEPLLVTVDYDEATAHAETDALVLTKTIPGELYRYMEAFVLEHYKPKPFEKRKRKKWVEDSARGGRR